MSRAKSIRVAALIALAGVGGLTGCTHNYYYGSVPVGVAPSTGMAVNHYGEVCEVPNSGGQVIVQNQGQPSYIVAPAPSRVVVSEPQGASPMRSSRSNRYAWRKPDPETVATTRVEGAIENDSKVR
jgi:hypothetical protein